VTLLKKVGLMCALNDAACSTRLRRLTWPLSMTFYMGRATPTPTPLIAQLVPLADFASHPDPDLKGQSSAAPMSFAGSRQRLHSERLEGWDRSVVAATVQTHGYALAGNVRVAPFPILRLTESRLDMFFLLGLSSM
jgi:hypothetical protein